MSHDPDSPFAPPDPKQEDFQRQEEASLPDLDITHVENLSVISFVTKAMEDRLIKAFWPLYVPLLAIDIPLFLAVLIVNVERILYTHLVDYFVAHVKYDARLTLNAIRRAFGREVEEEDDEDDDEGTVFGKLFYGLRTLGSFVWSVIIFALFLPIWPFIWIYNRLAHYLLIAVFYWLLFQFDLPGWEGSALFYLTFATVTFLIASISVPGLLQTFTYVKYLFSLERKPWREIRLEAKYAFLNLYFQIQRNKKSLYDTVEPRYARELKVEGGIYYLFLKTLHWFKDKALRLPKKNVLDVMIKLDEQLAQTRSDIALSRDEYHRSIGEIDGITVFKTLIALVITFAFSALLVFKGSHEQGLLGPLIFSFIEPETGLRIWDNYQGLGTGYYRNFFDSLGFPAFAVSIAELADWVLDVFFNALYALLPVYLEFLRAYYSWFWENAILSLFVRE